MRRTLTAICVVVFAVAALAEETAPPIAISLVPLGDSDQGVVARVSFRFAGAAGDQSQDGLVLQGSFMKGTEVVRNFRYAIEPDRRGDVTTIQTFPEGEIEIEARLLLPTEEGAPVMLAKSAQKFTIAKTNKPYVAAPDDGAEAVFAEGTVPERPSARCASSRRGATSRRTSSSSTSRLSRRSSASSSGSKGRRSSPATRHRSARSSTSASCRSASKCA